MTGVQTCALPILTRSPFDFKSDLVSAASGIISGYLTRRLVLKSPKNPFARILGVVLQYGVTNLVTKNAEAIKNLAIYYINKHIPKNIDRPETLISS